MTWRERVQRWREITDNRLDRGEKVFTDSTVYDLGEDLLAALGKAIVFLVLLLIIVPAHVMFYILGYVDEKREDRENDIRTVRD